ncbi:MAG: hypothetical protein ACR2P0_05115, partial [Acidimicrobiales bacterium]
MAELGGILKRAIALVVVIALAAIGTAIVDETPLSADAPSGCGSVGSAGVVPLSFPNPTGATVETETTTIGATATYAAVGDVDGQSIDARATLQVISGGTMEFENSTSDDASFIIRRSGGSAMSAQVQWEFYAAGDPASPVPVLSTWIIGDIDGNNRESLSLPKAGITAMQALTTNGVTIDTTGDPVTATGNLEWDAWTGTPPEESWAQLD